MTRKKRTLYATVGVFAAMSVFTVTAFASIQNASGYEKFKKAAMNTVQNQPNYTMEIETKAAIDGEAVTYSKNTTKYNGDKSMNAESISSYDDSIYMSSYQYPRYKPITEDTKYIRSMSILDGQRMGWMYDNDYKIGESDEDIMWDIVDNYSGYITESSNLISAYGSPSQIKLLEALVDLLIGDAKNYIITDGNKVTANLDKNKVPEIAQLYVAAVLESSANEYSTIPIEKDAIISLVTAEGIISNDIIENVKFNITIEGKDKDDKVREASVEINFSFTDVGTTIVETLEGKKQNQSLKTIPNVEIHFSIPDTEVLIEENILN